MVFYDHHDTSGRGQLSWFPSQEEIAYFDAIMDLWLLAKRWQGRAPVFGQPIHILT